MRNVLLICLFALYSAPGWTQTLVPDVTQINHAWVDGVYVNLEQLPNWGVFVDAQEETFFGAFYGYEGSDATFLILQGSISSASPLIYSGDVFFITNGGATATKVGDFTWDVRILEASPSASLTMSSNILNVTDLPLARFSFVEEDKIDVLTAADWNITTRVSGVSAAHHYGISDDRIVTGDITEAFLINNEDTDQVGSVAYFPPGSGEAYGMLVPYFEDTSLFAVFFTSDTEMFGRHWLLGPNDAPEGNGYYFHGSADTLQASNQELFPPDDPAKAGLDSDTRSRQHAETAALHRAKYEGAKMELTAMFPAATVQIIHENLSKAQ